MTNINRSKFILPVIAVLLFVGWFFLMDYGTSKAKFIERKVIAAINMAVEIQQRDGDRKQITDKSAGETFYAPHFSDPQQQFRSPSLT